MGKDVPEGAWEQFFIDVGKATQHLSDILGEMSSEDKLYEVITFVKEKGTKEFVYIGSRKETIVDIPGICNVESMGLSGFCKTNYTDGNGSDVFQIVIRLR